MVFTIHVRTLTPLWTGGIDRQTSIVRETGIIGSLRWWFEALVRGLGGYACDPTKYICDEKKWCDACDIFGTTGLQRAFRLEMNHYESPRPDECLIVKVKDGTSRSQRGWYLGRGVIQGELKLDLRPLRKPKWANSDDWLHSIGLAIQIAGKYGGFGARTQLGYGVINDLNMKLDGKEWDLNKALQAHDSQQKRARRLSVPSQQLPELRKFFFSKWRFPAPPDPEIFISTIADLQRYQCNECFRNFAQVPASHQKQNGQSCSGNIVDTLLFYLRNKIIPLSPVVRYYLRALLRQHLISGTNTGTANAPARWHVMGVNTAKYHSSDYGKLDRLWRCPTCNKVWNQQERPQQGAHPGCRTSPVQEWQCQSCRGWITEADSVKVERRGSLLHVSHAYATENEYEFRIWGWLPDELAGNTEREDVMMLLTHSILRVASLTPGNTEREDVMMLLAHSLGRLSYPSSYAVPAYNSFWSFMGGGVKCVEWREFNSKRDTVKQFSNPEDFLRSLAR